MGEVISQHPKMIKMWAKRYIDVVRKDGKAAAAKWGAEFYNKQDVPLIAREVKKIWTGKGWS